MCRPFCFQGYRLSLLGGPSLVTSQAVVLRRLGNQVTKFLIDTICRYRPVLEFLVEKALEPFCAHLNESIV